MSSITQQEQVKRDAIEALERIGGKMFREEDYKHEGNVLVIPASMTLGESWRYIRSLEQSYEEPTSFSRQFKYRPWDVAFNAYGALKRHFGSTRVTGMQSFFGTTPPRMIDIPISPTETVQVPWGVFSTPFLPDVTFEFAAMQDGEYGLVGVINANGPKKRAAAVQGVFELIERELREHSIYRGKAFTAEEMPRFVAVDIDPEKVVYSAQVRKEIEANIFAPIRYRAQLDELGVGSKRAVLLHGPFGTGKSLGIGLTAQEAVKSGWTAIIVRPGRDSVTDAFRTAKMYGPAVICVEDVDTIADAGQEANDLAHILELFDGVEAKNQDIMVVLTTNHVDKLHKGMVRPGRLDSVIEVGAPDDAGVRKLIEVNLNENLLDDEIDWDAVGQAMEGFLPAFVTEAATRALRYATVRVEGRTAEIKLTTEDLVYSAGSLRTHLALMNDAATHVDKPRIEQAIKETVTTAIDERIRMDLLVEKEVV